MLYPYYNKNILEAGCDEAGRGCLAGPVVAAAVIFPAGYRNRDLNDSKLLSRRKRNILRIEILKSAIAIGIGEADNDEIDEINILKATFLAMHRAIGQLKIIPEHLLIDGNRFIPYGNIPYSCIVKGDSKYMSIAAASIVAKTHRDDLMILEDQKYPQYGWKRNAGYPTRAHRRAIREFGVTVLHRKTFRLLDDQMKLFDAE